MDSHSLIDVIALEGELDIARRDEVRSLLQLNARDSAILVDFSKVTYVDSTIIAQILRFYNETVTAKRRIAILIGSPQFARILAYAGLSEVFPIFDDRADALQCLTSKQEG